MDPGELAQGERARYWRHPAAAGVDLLWARFREYRFTRHSHEGYTIGLIESGVEEFRIGGGVARATPGTIGLINPDVVHTGEAGVPAGWRYRVFYPSADVVAEVAADLGLRGLPSFIEPVVRDAEAARLLTAAHRAAEAAGGADPLAVSELLRAGLGRVIRAHGRQRAGRAVPAAGPAHVERARELLHGHVADGVSLDTLAEVAGCGPTSLVRAFRRATGLPPHAYLTQLRVREACRLLDAGVPASDVAGAVGFADQAHLTRHFKRHVGVTPGMYARAGTFKPAAAGAA
ncbi:MAG: helix-turn-helix domain-containing protein [Mycobacteriales bacterium]